MELSPGVPRCWFRATGLLTGPCDANLSRNSRVEADAFWPAARGTTAGGTMSEARLFDTTGRKRSPAATPGYRAGCPPANKGARYPADPPKVEEIIAVMRQAGTGIHADRVRGLIAVLWRAGLRINEALMLTETDLDPRAGSILIRCGKGGLCRMQHRPPYAAPGTMLRSGVAG
jgi:integrase